jgi:hypothetical protein
MKAFVAIVLVTILSAQTAVASGPQKTTKKPDPTKGGGDKGTPALSEVQWQTWGPTECMPLHPGALPAYRGRSAKFTYELRPISASAVTVTVGIVPYRCINLARIMSFLPIDKVFPASTAPVA